MNPLAVPKQFTDLLKCSGSFAVESAKFHGLEVITQVTIADRHALRKENCFLSELLRCVF